jgi:hypothetical protein
VLPAVVESLFLAAKAPTNFPRTDLVAAFLTGIAGVNQPKNVVASEMLRLDTSTPPTAPASQNAPGVAGAHHEVANSPDDTDADQTAFDAAVATTPEDTEPQPLG